MEIGRSYIALNANSTVPAVTGTTLLLTPSFSIDTSTVAPGQVAVKIGQAAGTAAKETITLVNNAAVGDELRITLVSNDTSRQLWRKSYSVTVQAGFITPTLVAAELSAQIALDGAQASCPYTASVAAGAITVVSKDLNKDSLNATVYTNSATTTITAIRTNGVLSEGQPSDLEARGIPATDISLATYSTVRFEYEPVAAQPFIDMKGKKSIEVFWYGTPANATALETIINAL